MSQPVHSRPILRFAPTAHSDGRAQGSVSRNEQSRVDHNRVSCHPRSNLGTKWHVNCKCAKQMQDGDEGLRAVSGVRLAREVPKP
jgi:hypothetical protein